ncbi:Zn-ribbon domain-containing protein [Candidatus Woesearchaeota archaeon]|nr:Zn-ribbon domain-containing protein [Candidatus Woesearchaeota archaeon]
MPHQCVRCGTFYDDGAQEILSGCSCGGRLFFFVRKEKLDAAKKFLPPDLSSSQKKQVEKDVLSLVNVQSDAPVVLDFESVRVIEPGKYELDIVKLFNGAPLVFKLEDGKYVVDIAETFSRLQKKK